MIICKPYVKILSQVPFPVQGMSLFIIGKVVNINLPENHPILTKCRPIYEYSWLIQEIKKGIANGLGRDEAIIGGIKAAKKNGVLVDFLKEHGSEVLNMIFTQFNMEDALEVRGEEKFQEGLEAGLAKGETLGEVKGEMRGEAQGEILKLISLVRKKMQKSASIKEIADALEEDSAYISPIYTLIRDNPDMTDKAVLHKILKSQ